MDASRYALYTAALLLAGLLLAGLVFRRGREDKRTVFLICFMGGAIVLWAALGFLQIGAEQSRPILKSCRCLIGGVFIGLAVALFTHLLLKRGETPGAGEMKPPD